MNKKSLSTKRKDFSVGPFVSGAGNRSFGLPISERVTLDNRYHIVQRLGGKFSSVYRAYDLTRDRDVAVKVVVTSPDQAQAAIQQLKQELSSRDSINDFTYIIKTYDIYSVVYQGLSLVLLTMEYAQGGDLVSGPGGLLRS